MATEKACKMSVVEQWKINRCNQNDLSSSRTLLSKDNRVAVCACGKGLLVYSIKTRKLLRKLNEHKTEVVDFYFCKKNPLQIISADESGVIIFWDYTDGILVKRLFLSYGITALIPHPTKDQHVFVAREDAQKGQKGKEKTKRHVLLAVDLASRSKAIKEGVLVGEKICSTSRNSRQIALSKEGDYIACVRGVKLQIYSLFDKQKRSFSSRGKLFTSIAFHPSRRMIATGTDDGRIILWTNFANCKTPITTELHWHAHPVEDLSFTNDGLYLLSAGMEAVLVTWQLDTLHRDFTSRLGGHITFLSVSQDDLMVAVTLKDNVVKVMSLVDRHLKSLLQGLSEVGDCSARMKQDPRTGCLVLPVNPAGNLQFYRPENDSVLMTLDVVGQNYVSGPGEKAINFAEVEHFDISYDGTWLATVERGSYKLIPDEIKLKFWNYNLRTQSFQLITVADSPHEDRIVALQMRPQTETSVFEKLAVTTAQDGKFKIWTLNAEEDEDETFQDIQSWQCHASRCYGTGPCGKLAFSQDGSLLAVVYDKTITIWDSEVGELRTTILSPVQNDPIRDVLFGAGSSVAYLLGRTTHFLFCWNLLDCSIHWSFEVQATCMAVDISSGLFAVAAMFPKGRQQLYLLDSITSKPVITLGKDRLKSKIKSMVFSQNDFEKLEVHGRCTDIGILYASTDDKDICRIGSEIEDSHGDDAQEVNEDAVQTDFEKIFGLGKVVDSLPINESSRLPPGMPSSRVIKKIISTPSHVLPPVTALCNTFFKAVTLTSDSSERFFGRGFLQKISHIRGKEWPIKAGVGQTEDEDHTDDSEHEHSDSEREDDDIKQVLSMESDHISLKEPTVTPSTSKPIKTFDFQWLSEFVKGNYK